MRKPAMLVSVVGLVLGSVTAASAITPVPIRDLLMADVNSGRAAEPAALESPAVDHLPENHHAKGLVFDGLRPGAQNSLCDGAYEIPLPNGTVLCTPGPEAGPPGLDVRAERTVADLAEGTAAGEAAGNAAEAGSGVPCIGDGVSGNRVQAIYAVASDRPDRFGEIAPLIAGWAGTVDEVFSYSAAQVGEDRHVRFVTDANCGLDIAHVVVSPTGDDTIMNTINEIFTAGYNRADRKYLIWMDAAVYCGISQVIPDDSPGASNRNNGGTAMFSRVDQGCWGGVYSVEAHELTHALGGVQPSAPHASANYHCTDEDDRMCYKDGADVVLTYDCPQENSPYLDCNHDDYYHPNPPPNSYLATHWNVASSSFLEAGPSVPPANQAPTADAGADSATQLPAPVVLDGSASDDGLPDGTLTTTWTRTSGPGTVSFADASAPQTSATFSAPGTYVLQLEADDGALSSADTTTVTVTDAPPANQAPTADAGADSATQLPAPVVLDGSASDDGLPDGTLTTTWTRTSGPGTVSFADASAPQTSATFSAPGTYVLQLEADDGALSSADTTTVTVTDAPPANQAPTADAGADSATQLPAPVVLDGSASDDGLPDGTLTTTWTRTSGPGTVSFADASAPQTSATFSAPGTYVLQLEADDGALSSADTTTVTVTDAEPGATTEQFSDRLNRKHVTRSYEINAGAGPAEAVLTFNAGKGKRAALRQLTVTVFDSAGDTLGTATGSSPVELLTDLPAGTCTLVVSGSMNTSFDLFVTHTNP